MKRLVSVFLLVALLALAIVPAINLISHEPKEGTAWWRKENLYNFDFVMQGVSRVLYSFGISTDPGQTVIGSDGWLFLGDAHAESIRVIRRAVTAEDADTAERIGSATKACERWLRKQGVRVFKVLVSSDKSSIYPEMLPHWARPNDAAAGHGVTDRLMSAVDKSIHIDTRPDVLAAKTNLPAPLFYKTDTHWNGLGAWAAFRALQKNLAQADPGFRPLEENAVRMSGSTTVPGGDLARFLRLSGMLSDEEPVTDIVGTAAVETRQFDYETGRMLKSGGNPRVWATKQPLLVKSSSTLNKAKVLWLRDSFGISMSPFMAATFSETLQVLYDSIDATGFSNLVLSYKPDYVVISVVERNARLPWFQNLPPVRSIVSPGDEDFVGLARAERGAVNDLMPIGSAGAFRVRGVDPFMTFGLVRAVPASRASRLVFDLHCEAAGRGPVHLQLFWHAEGGGFNESQSYRFVAEPGVTSIDVAKLAAWQRAGSISGLRLDFDSPEACAEPAIARLEVGR